MGDVIRGPWPTAEQKPMPFKWRSEFPSTVEERRAAILESRPRCTICDRIYPLNVKPRAVCRDCQRDIDANTDPTDPVIF